ncbi:hypothetical protein glysoja_032950 [Glycine soja]|uniref:Uncharacterized protein n=1 Tax=Glycine soja TaxID=3848 RepID=A0A0B2RRB2_GLYSO|nr:hypothetical protein glysoja_032950 [Glycine soja]
MEESGSGGVWWCCSPLKMIVESLRIMSCNKVVFASIMLLTTLPLSTLVRLGRHSGRIRSDGGRPDPWVGPVGLVRVGLEPDRVEVGTLDGRSGFDRENGIQLGNTKQMMMTFHNNNYL